jgi:uncharacterized membrane protein
MGILSRNKRCFSIIKRIKKKEEEEKMPYTKSIGAIMVVTGVLFLIVLISLIDQINESKEGSCGCAPNTCPMAEGLPIHIYLGIIAILVLVIIGLFLILKTKWVEKESIENEKKLKEQVSLLDGDEKKIYEIIFNSEGVIFQSDLVEESELPKAKVSRILDKLEGRGLVERKRRGLGNIVLLRRP